MEVSREFAVNAWKQSGEVWERKADKALSSAGGRVLVLAGHGITLKVERDALIVQDGFRQVGREPVTHVLYRGTHVVERIAVVSTSGNLSLRALEWCREQEIALDVYDMDGELALSSFGGREGSDVALRRAQYLAMSNGRNVEIARHLAVAKLRAQIATLEYIATMPEVEYRRKGVQRKGFGFRRPAGELAERLTDVIGAVSVADSMVVIRGLDGGTSGAYYGTMEGIPLTWKVRDRKLVPPHWLIVGPRLSPLSENGRKAVDPVNAMRNVAFACLAGQCRLAIVARGA